MPTLSKLLDGLPVRDSLKEREENPLSKAGAWVKGFAGASNTGKVTPTGWAVTGGSSVAQARWDSDQWETEEWAVGITLPAMGTGDVLMLAWAGAAAGEAAGGLDAYAEIAAEGAGKYYVVVLEGEEYAEEGSVTISAGDVLAVASFSGTLMLCKKHSGIWTTLVECGVDLLPSEPRKASLWLFPSGTSTRITDFAAGSLSIPPPTVTTGAATDIRTKSALLHGEVNPNESAATCRFEYSRKGAIRGKLLELDPLYCLAPETPSEPLEDLGSVEAPDAVLKNGAALIAPGLLPGLASAALDGTNDYIDTGWATRINLLDDPLCLSGTAWGNYNGSAVTPVAGETGKGLPDGVTTAIKSPLAAGYAAAWLVTGNRPVVAGQTYAASMYGAAAVDVLSQRLTIQWFDGEGSHLEEDDEGLPIIAPPVGVYTPASCIATAPEEAAFARIYLLFTATADAAHEGKDIYGAAAMLELAPEVRPYFPRAQEIESGGAAQDPVTGQWDLGWALRGGEHTYVGFARRDSAGLCCMLGGSLGHFAFQLQPESDYFILYLDAFAGFSSAWKVLPATGEEFFWALRVHVPDNEAELFIDGVSVGVEDLNGTSYSETPESLWLGSYPGQPMGGAVLPFSVYGKGLT